MKFIRRWIIDLVIGSIKIGANCGCCGKRMEHEIVRISWDWSICDECIEQGQKAMLNAEDDHAKSNN